MLKSLITYALFALMLSPGQSAFTGGRTGAVAATAGGGGSSIAFVGGIAVNAMANTTVTTGSYSCTPGDFIYIVASTDYANEVFTITGTKETVSAFSTTNSGTGLTSIATAHVSSCVGGTGTFTGTVHVGGGFSEWDFIELSHVTAIDATNNCHSGGFAATCTVTATGTNDFVIGSIHAQECSPSQTDAWTDLGSLLTPSLAGSSTVGHWGKLQTTSGTITLHMSAGCGSSGGDTEIMTAFK